METHTFLIKLEQRTLKHFFAPWMVCFNIAESMVVTLEVHDPTEASLAGKSFSILTDLSNFFCNPRTLTKQYICVYLVLMVTFSLTFERADNFGTVCC